MSGGVDSSVAAALLTEQGHEVTGIMLRLWSEAGSEETNRCCTPDALFMARRVAARLEIPFYTLDAQEIFHHEVVEYFIRGYAKNTTPNPCLACNRWIRWGFLLNHTIALGADYLATGHYARLEYQHDREVKLLKGKDTNKDQSYVLHLLTQDQLKQTILPIGEYTKNEVRELARHFNLPVAERAESQDLCFLGDGDYRSFLIEYAPEANKPGPIINSRGEILGSHAGLANYTIGQRKGIQISSPVPLYVLGKDMKENSLLVGTRDELGQTTLIAHQVNWISGVAPVNPFSAQIKIRYKSQEEKGLVSPLSPTSVHVLFVNALRDITPGQSVVFYDGDICLGGGVIDQPTP